MDDALLWGGATELHAAVEPVAAQAVSVRLDGGRGVVGARLEGFKSRALKGSETEQQLLPGRDESTLTQPLELLFMGVSALGGAPCAGVEAMRAHRRAHRRNGGLRNAAC
jgi:hypothetical protein